MVILLKINSEQLYARSNQREFHLTQEINTPHPQSGLHLLDYCLVAGLTELAARFCYSGAVCKSDKTFINNVTTNFIDNENSPEIMQDIHATLSKISYIHLSNSKLNVQPKTDKSILQKIQTLYSDHPYSALLFTVGAACSLISPFAHGYATALLLSVGVPSMLSGVNLLQNSTGGRANMQQMRLKDSQSYEAKEVRQWITMVKEMNQEILASRAASNRMVEPVRLLENIGDPNTRRLLFSYESTDSRSATPPVQSTFNPELKSLQT